MTQPPTDTSAPPVTDGYPTYPNPHEGDPPYVPQPHQHQPKPLLPLRGLAIGACTAASALAGIQVLEAGLAWPARAAYLDAAANGELGIDVFTAYDFASLPLIPVGIVAYVLTCLWLHRARSNAETLQPGVTHARKAGWVWAGWLVPFVSLWFPFQIIRDVADDPRSFRTHPVIGWWWAFWLLSLITAQIGFRLTGFGEIDTSAVQALGLVETLDAAVTVTALILWLIVIRDITRTQDEAIARARGSR